MWFVRGELREIGIAKQCVSDGSRVHCSVAAAANMGGDLWRRPCGVGEGGTGSPPTIDIEVDKIPQKLNFGLYVDYMILNDIVKIRANPNGASWIITLYSLNRS